MTNQFTDEQVLAALNAYSGKGLETDGYIPGEGFRSLEEGGDRFTQQMRAALEAAAGAAPKAESNRKLLAGRLQEALGLVVDDDNGFRSREIFVETDLVEEVVAALVAPVQPSRTVDEKKVEEALRVALDDSDAMHCTRAWSAWGYGTMTSTDFKPLTEDQDAMDELVCAVIEALSDGASDVPEPEWEYAIFTDTGDVWQYPEQTLEYVRNQLHSRTKFVGGVMERRRKAGEWERVEGESD